MTQPLSHGGPFTRLCRGPCLEKPSKHPCYWWSTCKL